MNAFLARTLRQSGVLMAFVLACSAGCAPPAVGGAVESQPFRMNAVLDQNLMLVEASGLSSRPVISDTRAIALLDPVVIAFPPVWNPQTGGPIHAVLDCKAPNAELQSIVRSVFATSSPVKPKLSRR